MATALDDTPDALTAQSLQRLDAILQAATRPALATALAQYRTFLQALIEAGDIGVNDARRLGAVANKAADERLRDLPEPGAPKPVGLFGGQA